MMKDYAIEVKQFPKENRLFDVCFDFTYVPLLDDRKVTTCTIVEMPSKKVYAGAAIKNPKDICYDGWIGRRLAFKRAVYFLWMVWADRGKTGMPFEPFWQLFRRALAENEIYLSERKAK
jgi:hypothetical protein